MNTPLSVSACPVSLALGKAIGDLARLQIPRVRGSADADDLEGRAELLVTIAKIFDPVIYAIGSEGAEHSHEIVRGDWTSIVSDALEDRALLSQFTSGADQLRDDETEAAERPGSARAREAMGA